MDLLTLFGICLHQQKKFSILSSRKSRLSSSPRSWTTSRFRKRQAPGISFLRPVKNLQKRKRWKFAPDSRVRCQTRFSTRSRTPFGTATAWLTPSSRPCRTTCSFRSIRSRRCIAFTTTGSGMHFVSDESMPSSFPEWTAGKKKFGFLIKIICLKQCISEKMVKLPISSVTDWANDTLDWAIFDRSWWHNFSIKSIPNISWLLQPFENVIIKLKSAVATFWATLWKIGLLFILTV